MSRFSSRNLELSPDQIVLLLERLLEQKTLNPQTLQRLQQTYHLQEQDAEVTGLKRCAPLMAMRHCSLA